MAIQTVTFDRLCDSYLEWLELEVEGERATQSKLNDYQQIITTFVKVYFSGKKLDAITDADITGYHDWRRSYWVTGPGSTAEKQQYRRQGKIVKSGRAPRKITGGGRLNYENTVIRSFFDFAQQRGWISSQQIPRIKNEATNTKRRPWFTTEELSELRTVLRERAEETPEGQRRELRWLLYNFVILLAYSGIRPGEAHGLRWVDFVELELRDGTKAKGFLC